MSNRERWIVYPLLFYALVMGFKATYQDPMEFRCRSIECQQLNVKLINGTPAFGWSLATAKSLAALANGVGAAVEQGAGAQGDDAGEAAESESSTKPRKTDAEHGSASNAAAEEAPADQDHAPDESSASDPASGESAPREPADDGDA